MKSLCKTGNENALSSITAMYELNGQIKLLEAIVLERVKLLWL